MLHLCVKCLVNVISVFITCLITRHYWKQLFHRMQLTTQFIQTNVKKFEPVFVLPMKSKFGNACKNVYTSENFAIGIVAIENIAISKTWQQSKMCIKNVVTICCLSP